LRNAAAASALERLVGASGTDSRTTPSRHPPSTLAMNVTIGCEVATALVLAVIVVEAARQLRLKAPSVA
jgi:hypothetical protein